MSFRTPAPSRTEWYYVALPLVFQPCKTRAPFWRAMYFTDTTLKSNFFSRLFYVTLHISVSFWTNRLKFSYCNIYAFVPLVLTLATNAIFFLELYHFNKFWKQTQRNFHYEPSAMGFVDARIPVEVDFTFISFFQNNNATGELWNIDAGVRWVICQIEYRNNIIDDYVLASSA